MRKRYSNEFKWEVVNYYLTTPYGQKATARHFHVSRATVRLWLYQYKAAGREGLCRPEGFHPHYPLEFKRQVVMTLLTEQLSLRQASIRFGGITSSTILQWRKQYDAGRLGHIKEKRMAKRVYRPDTSKPDSEKSVKELIRELEYMRAENAYLKKLDALLKKKAAAAKATPSSPHKKKPSS